MPKIYSDQDRYSIRPFIIRFDPAEIPSTDINAEPLHCLKINEMWVPHFLGILNYLEQLDTWKGTENERLLAVQAIEKKLLELAKICIPCPDGESDQGNGQDNNGQAQGSAILESEDDDMGQSVTDVSLVNGMIRVFFGPCCYKDLEFEDGTPVVVGHGTGVDQGIPDKVDVDPENPPESLACRKATAFADMFFEVAEYGWDLLGVLTGMASWIGGMQAHYPQFDMSWTELIEPLTTLGVIKALSAWGGWDSAFPAAQKQAIMCKWNKILSNNTLQVTNDEFNAMRSVLQQEIIPVEMWYYCRDIMDTLDVSAFRWTALNAPSIEHDGCPCPDTTDPDAIPPGLGHTWSKVLDFTQGSYGFTGSGGQVLVHHVPGTGWVCDQLEGGGANVPAIQRFPPHDDPVPCELLYCKIYFASWPDNLTVWGGSPLWLHWGGQDLWTSAGVRGQDVGIWTGFRETSVAQLMKFGGLSEYYVGAGNENFEAVISKIVLAGRGGDMISGLQPDGTWSEE